MTWNVWWRFGGAWREREPGIVATLARVRPDVVGLVETWAGEGTTQARRLADRLGMAAARFASTSLPPVPDPPEEPTQDGMHILARPGRGGLTVRRAFLAGDHPVDGRHPSDHFAVVADLDP